MKKKKGIAVAAALVTSLVLVCGCGRYVKQTDTSEIEMVYTDQVALEEVTLKDEAVALSEGPGSGPAVANDLSNVKASGIAEKRSGKAVIDHSHTSDGYVMVQFTENTSKRLKAQVKGPTTTYTYNLNQKEWTVFPLSDGNGTYQVSVFENVSGDRYAAVVSTSFDTTLHDEFAPFVRPNQYVDYEKAPNTLAKAAELTKDITDPLKKVEAVYDYVVQNLTYDNEKAANVKSGYLPVLDTVLAENKGICFDYAALMTGMLRSQGVPCKLVVGYAGSIYHAWISVWTEGTGWVDGVIYFDGNSWHRMDPTFASSNNNNAAILEYIGNGTNYTAKYLY